MSEINRETDESAFNPQLNGETEPADLAEIIVHNCINLDNKPSGTANSIERLMKNSGIKLTNTNQWKTSVATSEILRKLVPLGVYLNMRRKIATFLRISGGYSRYKAKLYPRTML